MSEMKIKTVCKSNLLPAALVGGLLMLAGCSTTTTPPDQAATPTFDPPGGTFMDSVDVTISTATGGATIMYATASDETMRVFTGPIHLTETTELRANATSPSTTESDTATATYTIVSSAAPTGGLVGKVTAPGDVPLSGVTVTAGTAESPAPATTTTDALGEYTIDGLDPTERLVVAYELAGYTQGARITEIQDGVSSYVEALLTPIETAEAISATAGGTVTATSGAAVDIVPNGLVDSTGAEFTGMATVNVSGFDPTTDEGFDAFPGEFEGVTDSGEVAPFSSYGFMDVTVTDTTGVALGLASGTTAQLTMPIPASLLASAPATIDLWYFDDTDGRWHQEGTATRVGDTYVGDVSHLTPWNFDVLWTNFSGVIGRVVDCETGEPVRGASVVVKGDNWAAGETSTGSDGRFSIGVSGDEDAVIHAAKNGVSGRPVAFHTLPTSSPEPLDVGDIYSCIPTATVGGECQNDSNCGIGEVCEGGECVGQATGGIVQLTTSSADDLDPAWDPASDLIAFRTDRFPSVAGALAVHNIGGVQADGSDEGNLAVGPNSGYGIALSLTWVGTTGLLMTNERVVFHEYMAFDTSQAPFTRSANDGDDAAFELKLFITGGGGGDFFAVSRDGNTVIWRFRPSTSGSTDSLRYATYSSLNGQNADAVGSVLLTDDEFAWLGAAGLTPDGSQMVISLSSGGGFDLFLYTVASPPVLVRQLTTSGESAEVFNANPDVSPDGTVVAFDRTFPGGDADLWSIGIDGTGSTALTVGEQDESHPSWSPDGDRIAFQRYDDDNWNIYVLALDGSGGGAECQTDADCDADETCDSGQCVAPTSATQATLTHMSGFDFSTGTIPATGEDDDGSILAWAPFPSAAPAGGGSSTDLWFWARANTADENFTKDMGMVLLSSITAVPDTWDAGKDLPLDPLQVDHVYVVKCRDGYAKFLVKSLDPFGEDWSAEVDYVFTAGLTFDQ